MNEELRMKLENFFQLSEDDIIKQDDNSIIYANYKEKFQISVAYEENRDIFIGILYLNLGSESFEKVNTFKFYNSLNGDIEFDDEFKMLLVGPEQMENGFIQVKNSNLYPKGHILRVYPLYVVLSEDKSSLWVTDNSTIETEMLDYFLEDYGD